ncbi:mannose-1-phosphate guanyltransferase [Halobacteriales archaeon SW_5_70_135]|nr:MAG: mannose-1-phosphate guanyltransferase [Halobacteriales archaeon SW_5_70_135]
MDRPVVAVVLAGGSGTRLYPASRADRPKQLLSVGDDDRSLLARTLGRVAAADRRVVLTGPDHADRVRDRLADREDVPTADVWVEPAPRDTGPALVYAAARARETFEDPVLCCLPSDHYVSGDFAAVLRRATAAAAETRGLVCVGVEPDRPATGYGYVRPGEAAGGYAPVEAFHEKPDAERARGLVEAGALWNAGVFAWTPGALLSAAADTPLGPLVRAVDDDGDGGEGEGEGEDGRGEDGESDGLAALEAAYGDLDPVSVDRAVLERADDVSVVPADGIEWDDLGTWDALARVLPADADGNVVGGDALTVDAEDTVIVAEGAHVAAVGVEDLVVAAVGDRVLVAPRGETDRVREVVARLREKGQF